jgi:hypothetical protein
VADDDVAAAVGIGWYLAALAHPGAVTGTAAAARGELAGVEALTQGQMLEYCQGQVEVGFGKLKELIDKAGLALPELTELRKCIESAQDELRGKEAGAVAIKALAVLSAVDFRVGKAFGVGWGLLQLTSRPSEHATLAQHLTAARIAAVVAAVDDLSSALAPHAGHSVAASIMEWRASIRDGSRVVPEHVDTWAQLARQGELWRTVLAGEKSGADMLEIADYVDAAERLSMRMREVAKRFLSKFPLIAIGLPVVLVLSTVAIAVFHDAAAISAGLTAVFATVGISWHGVGRGLGGLAAKLEQPLWGAELDVAITQAITLLPREADRDVTRTRRDVAQALGVRDDVSADRSSG